MNTETKIEDFGQKRARKGGEFGPNGEWYDGGVFIATKDNPKSAPRAAWEPTAEERAAYEAKKAAQNDRAARVEAWLLGRRAKFDALLKHLCARPVGHFIPEENWKDAVRQHAAGFEASLGYSLLISGYLSPRQAHFAAKIFLGRPTKKNADEFDALVADLSEDFA